MRAGILTYVDLVACSESFQQGLLMNLEVQGSYYRQKNLIRVKLKARYLNDLKLNLIVPLGHTVANGFDYGIDQLPW
jgi:invasion protein IalB